LSFKSLNNWSILQIKFSTPNLDYYAALCEMISKALRIAACLLTLLSLAGCADLASLLSTLTPAPTSQATTTPEPSASTTPTPPFDVEPRILRVWLPPHFDPNTDTNAAQLLRQRLAEFQASQRGLRIEVRIKAVEGKAGLLNSLSVTSVAAPGDRK
jgi:hypothetical protein